HRMLRFFAPVVCARGADLLSHLRATSAQGHGGRDCGATAGATRRVAVVRAFSRQPRRTPAGPGVARPPFRTSKEGLDAPFPGWARVRSLDAGIAARYRLQPYGLRPGGPHFDTGGLAPAPGRYHRNLLQGGRRSPV